MSGLDKLSVDDKYKIDETFKLGNEEPESDELELGDTIFSACDSCRMGPICEAYAAIQTIRKLGIQTIVINCRFHTGGNNEA